jgi:hypothetical protein
MAPEKFAAAFGRAFPDKISSAPEKKNKFTRDLCVEGAKKSHYIPG